VQFLCVIHTDHGIVRGLGGRGDHFGYAEEKTDFQVSCSLKNPMQWYRIGVNKIPATIDTVCDVFTSRSVSLRDVFRKRSVAKGSRQDDGNCRATTFWRV